MGLKMYDWDEYERWIKQAKHTFNAIKADIQFKNYSWACFKAHQAAEYALKGFLRGTGQPAFGYDLRALTMEVAKYCGSSRDVTEAVLALSKFYIPSRYPDAFPGGAPYEFYTQKDAEEALAYARKIIDWVEACVKRLRKID